MTPEELRALADEAEKSGWTSGEDVRARFWLHDNAPDLTRLCAELAQIVEASQRVLHTHGASSRYCAACHRCWPDSC